MIVTTEKASEKFDFCVVGAGAAGITLALTLARAGKSVALVESGGFEPNEKIQQKNDGTSFFFKHYTDKAYLNWSRARRFGGTTNLWKGVCHPLQEWDLEKREWISHSGWPISYDELWPYYNKAAPWVQIQDFQRDESFVPNFFPQLKSLPSFETNLLQMSPPTRFGDVYRKEIVDSDKISLFLETDLIGIKLSPSREQVEHLEVQKAGKTFRLSANKYALCMGSIENAAELLKSNIGNERKNVGAYFMEHLFLPIGIVYAPFAYRSEPIHAPHSSLTYPPELTFSLGHEAQKKDKLLQVRFHFQKLDHELDEGKFFDPQLKKANVSPSYHYLFALAETAPVKGNRVFLKDGKPSLTFDIGELERRTVEAAPKYLARDLGLAAFGRVQHDAKEFEGSLKASPFGCHQMGTTRMAKNANDGVVDSNQKVFGISNLYCAGSSVFPTGGCQNPTLTLLALTVRLAEHLQSLKS